MFLQAVSQKDSVMIELDLLEIKEKSICTILDSIIKYEKGCGYYSDSMAFIVHTYVDTSYNDTLIMIITSTNNLQSKIDETCLGYLLYKDHDVIIRDQLIDIFFERTDTRKQYSYIEYKIPIAGLETSHGWSFFYDRNKSIFIRDTYPKPCP
jgi:hypothetical protein